MTMKGLYDILMTVHPMLGFGICAVVIILSGIRLSRYGAIIAERTGLSRAWVGLFLVASITSLPELITGISSVTMLSAPDIAVGDVLGSCCFNLLILSVLDALIKPQPLLSTVRRGHILTGAFGIVMLSAVVINVLYVSIIPPLGWLSTGSIVFLLIYTLALRLTYQHEKKDPETTLVPSKSASDITLSTAYFRYFLNAVLLVIGAVGLPYFAITMATLYELEQSFVGTLFVAATTSLPELVVSIAAVRMGTVDIAVGNLFGSNLFNIVILAVDDAFYSRGLLLASANPNHMLSALAAIMMTSVAAIGLTYRPERKRIILAADSLVILFIYLLLITTLYISC